MTNRRREALAAGAALAAGTIAGPLRAQSAYPSRPIRVIVPWPPGGNADPMMRALGERMTQLLGQPLVIENRPGGTGLIGANLAARSPADGYTLLLLASTFVTGQALSGNREIELARDFDPIGQFASTPLVLDVHPGVPARTLPELVAYAKANPGKLAGASGSVGSTAHLLLELMKLRLGLDITHVPFQGGGQAITALIGGHVHLYFDVPPTAIPAARDGRVRLLAVTAPTRVPFMPDLPTFKELGFDDMVASVWLGLMAPKGTPEPILARLNDTMKSALADPTVVQRFETTGSTPAHGTPEALVALAKSDLDRWTEVVRRANIKAS